MKVYLFYVEAGFSFELKKIYLNKLDAENAIKKTQHRLNCKIMEFYVVTDLDKALSEEVWKQFLSPDKG